MPVPFREALLARGMSFVEVPDEEFESMGANVLAVAPRTCVMLDGNPATRAPPRAGRRGRAHVTTAARSASRAAEDRRA